MRVKRQGKESYYALLDAGESWYDLRKTCDIFLGAEKSLSFVITPLTGKNVETKKIPLTGAEKNDAPFARYELEVSMAGADIVQIKVTDLGLGEFFPSNGQIWEESFQIS